MNEHKIHLHYIDMLKGFGIFLVVLGHTHIGEEMAKFIFSFHMPLFFFISGFLFNKDIPFIIFLKSKFKRIINPYLFFSLSSFLLYWIPAKIRNVDNIIGWKEFLLGTTLGLSDPPFLSWNIVLWYLPALFCLLILAYTISKCPGKIGIIIIVILTLTGFWLSKFNLLYFPYSINSVLSVLPFFYIGLIMKNVKITGILKLSAIIIGAFLLGFICLIHNGIVDVRINQLGNPFLFLINASSFIIVFFFIFQMIPTFKIIRWLGLNSLAIMCLHLKAQFVPYLILSKFTEGILKCLLVTIISIILLIPVIFILNRYFPFLVGNKTKKNG